MYKSFALLLACLVLGSGCFKTSQNIQTADFSLVNKEKSLLWQVEGKDLEKPSYVFGTIHIIAAENYFLTDEIRKAFQDAEAVAFEIDLEEMMDFSNLLPILMKSYMPDGKTLRDLVSEEDYILLKKHFKDKGLVIDWFERIKPMFLSALIGPDMNETGQDGEKKSKSYELEFMEMAKEDNKEVYGLETTEFQMSLFDSIPLVEQAEMLVAAIKSPDQGSEQEELDRLSQLYIDQDIHELKRMISNDSEGIGKHDYVLIDKRNISWIPIMKELMYEKSMFFAVGAGHLAGEQGVLRLLEKDGYVVTPVLELKKS